jgi:hypothetical protein
VPHSTLKLIPGVDVNKTPTLNEAAISSTNLVRFVPDRTGLGLVQKLGGWTKFPGSSFSPWPQAIIRSLWAWQDTNNNSYLAYGTESRVNDSQAELGVINYNSASPSSSASNDVTPQAIYDNVTVDVSVIEDSSIFTIVDATTTGITRYDSVFVTTQISIGGVVLFGLYPCATDSSTSYKIQAHNILGDAQFATSTVNNGGSVSLFTSVNESSAIIVTLNNHGYSIGDTFPALVSTSLDSSIAVTGASGTTTIATLTYSGATTYDLGGSITVTGMTPSGYNGVHTVTASSAGSVSFSSTTTGFTSGGLIGAVGPVIYGNYIVQSLGDLNGTSPESRFIINASNAAITEVNVYMNNGDARFIYSFGYGAPITGTGYGIGGYGAGGYGTGSPITASSGTPISATDWSLDNWGEILIANPQGNTIDEVSFNPIYEWNPTSNPQTAVIIPQAPSTNAGAFVAMPQRQIVAWGSTFTGVPDPLLIRWCDVNNFNSWIGTVVNQAGSYRIPKGSKIVQCIQGPQQGLIWTDLALWAMQYSGLPFIYQFNEIGTGCGLIGHRAAGSMNGVVYWMGQSQFFRLAGSGVEPIPCPIWDVIFQDIDMSNRDKIRVATNSRFGEIAWYYPTTDNGEVNKYVKYNVILNQWDYGTLSRSAWINESVLGPPIGADPTNYSPIEGQYRYYIYQHETSPNADTLSMLSSFQTGYFSLSDGDLKTFVDQVWPDMKWGYYNGNQNADVNITFYVTDYPGDTPIQYGPYTMTQQVQYITPRFRARLVSIKIDSSDYDTWWRLGGIRYRLQQDGKF